MTDATQTLFADVHVESTTHRYAKVDVEKLIAAFPDEYREFCDGEEPEWPNEALRLEFVKDTLYEMGSDDFFLPGESPWIVEVKDDDDLSVDVRRGN